MSDDNGYILGKRIARGGMAEIYLGKAVGKDAFQRICAIKRILPHYSSDKEFVKMFRDEAHICKRLQHANIVQVYDFQEVDGSYAIIMEHINGADYRTVLHACEEGNVRLPIPFAVYVAAMAARGLHYAHTKTDEITGKPLGVIHRDISPQNILLSFEGEVKITDFGIASADDKLNETRPGVVKGKYSYMSPEQVSAKPLDALSDVFSLAIVLWESLAMKRLFGGQSEVETIRKVQNCDISENLMDLNKDVDADLMSIIAKALQKDKKKRFTSAADFEKTLLKYLNKRFSDFTQGDLADFLKTHMAKRRGESQDIIKETLTKANAPAAPRESKLNAIREKLDRGASKKNTGNKSGIELELKDDSVSKIAVGQASPTGSIQVNSELSTSSNRPTGIPMTGARTATPGIATASRQARPTMGTHQPHYHHSRRRSKAGRDPKLVAAGIGVVVILALVIWSFSSPGKVNLTISSVPSNVTVSINNKRINRGYYIKTPTEFPIPSGRYQIQISRKGYRTENLIIDESMGDSIRKDVVLRPLNPDAFGKVRISAQDPNTYVSVNQGFYKGQTPVLIDDLAVGSYHYMSVYPNYPKKAGAFRCKFKALSRNIRKPTLVQVTNKGCRVK